MAIVAQKSDVAPGPLVRFGKKCMLVLIFILLMSLIVQVGNWSVFWLAHTCILFLSPYQVSCRKNFFFTYMCKYVNFYAQHTVAMM